MPRRLEFRRLPGRRAPGPPARLRRALVVPVALAVLAGSAAGAQEAGSGLDGSRLYREYQDLVGAEADLLVAYDRSAAAVVEHLTAAVAAEQQVQEVGRRLAQVEVALVAGRAEEAAATVALAEARTRLVRAEEGLRRHVVESYMADGTAAGLAALADTLAGDTSGVARRGYRESISDQQRELVDELVAARRARDAAVGRAHRARLAAEDRHAQVSALRDAAVTARDEVVERLVAAADERRRQEVLLADLRDRKGAIEARIVALELAADSITEVLAAVQADDPPWEPGAVAVASPSPGSPIGSDFGPRHHPILAVSRLHAGVDIGAATGAPVRAAADGEVVLAEERGGYGLTVVIAHGYSLATVYAHCSSLLVAPGDRVEQGDVVARVGSTGLSTGPHIHFETRLRGVPLDPRSFLADA